MLNAQNAVMIKVSNNPPSCLAAEAARSPPPKKKIYVNLRVKASTNKTSPAFLLAA
jgi:hypothetical protein